MLDKGKHPDRHQIHASDAECNHSPQSEDRWEKVTAASTEQLCEASWWSLQPATEAHPLQPSYESQSGNNSMSISNY